MTNDSSATVKTRIQAIRQLSDDERGGDDWMQAAMLAQSVLHDTLGSHHPVAVSLKNALENADYTRAKAGARSVATLFEQGALTNPRLAIAHEIEGEILDIAQMQVQAAENSAPPIKQLQLAIAAFLAGAALEDALRRLCVAHGIPFDTQRSSLSKLQSALYQPSNQVERISSSENKQITSWGDTRNKADHGKFDSLTHTEALTMVLGVRTFVDKHLP